MEILYEPVARADLPALVEWLGSDSWPFHGRSSLDAGQAAAIAATYFAPDVEAFWIVAAGGERAGLIRLFDLEDYTPLFDLRLRSPFRGRGIGTGAVEWLTRHIFETWPEKGRIEAHTRQDNGAMRRVLRRCAYVKEAHHRRAWPAGPGPRLDSVGYAILRVDWERGGPPTPVAWDDEPATDNPR